MPQKYKIDNNGRKLLIIDVGVLDAEILIKDLNPEYQVIWLDPKSESVTQLTDAIQMHAPVQEVALIAHATPGQIHFSSGLFGLPQLEQHQQQLQTWRNSLTADAKFCIYACSLASGEIGQEFIHTLKDLTGAEVASSSLPIGKVGTGQNWSLDRFTQSFEALMPFSENSRAAYQYTLDTVLRLTEGRVDEGDIGTAGLRTLEFTWSLEGEAATQDITFSYQTLSGTATEDIDFFRKVETFTIFAGQTTGTLSVTVLGDIIDEADEDFFLELFNLSDNAVFADGALSIRTQGIIDDQDGGGLNRALFVNDPVVVEGDSGGHMVEFAVRLSEPSSESITLDYATADGSARAGEDYTATSGTVSFAPNETEATVSIEVLGDTMLEGNESFSLVVTPTAAIANGVFGAAGIATIRDDDAGSLPMLSVVGSRVQEGNTGTAGLRSLEFTLSLSKVASQDITFDYQTLSGTAAEDVDFFRAVDTFTIFQGQTTAILPVTILGDGNDETDEDFFLELGNLSGAVFPDGVLTIRAQGIIDDQDGAGLNRALFVDNPIVVEGNSGTRTAEFTVRLSEPSSDTVSVNYTTAPNTATSGVDYTPVNGALTFLPGQTVAAVQVNVLSDADVEKSEMFSLILSEPLGATLGDVGSGSGGLAKILDDDGGGFLDPVISIDDGQVIERDIGSAGFINLEFVVRLSAPSSQAITVDYATSDGTAVVADGDYTAKTGTVSFAPGETLKSFFVTVSGDVLVEPDEIFVATLSNPQNAILAGEGSTLDAAGTIIDNDGAAPIESLPELSVADITVAEQPGGTTATFTLNLSNVSPAPVGGQLEVIAGTATAGADFTAIASKSFVINALELSTTVTVDILDDTLVEDTETFVLRISDLVNVQLSGSTDTLFAIGEITDNDSTASGVSINPLTDATIDEGNVASRTVSFSDGEDASGDGWTYSVDYGDGTAVENGSIAAGSNSFDISHAYADGDANHDVSVTVTDTASDSDTEQFTVTVNNVVPMIALAGAAEVNTGASYTLNLGAITDPGDDTVASYIVDWGDGTSDTYTTAGDVTHTYASSGNNTISVDLEDEDGTHTKAGTLDVNVVPPTSGVSINPLTDATIDEGNVASRTITFSDGEDTGGDGWTYSVDYGDGSAIETGNVAAGVNSFDISHAYADGDANHDVSVTVTDTASDSDTEQFTVTVNNVVPMIALAGAAEVNTGASYTLNLGAITDPGDDTVASYIVDWGDGTSDTYTTAGDVTHTYASAGNNTISVDLVDEDGTHTDVGSLSVKVISDGPSINPLTNVTIDEGNVASRTITFSDGEDTGGDGWTYSVDYGDGSAIETGNVAAGVNSFDISHAYADGDANHDVSVTVTDTAGDSDTEQFTVTVNNVVPMIALAGAAEVNTGASYTLNLGAITDPGDDTVTSYIVDWGDGSSNTFNTAGDVTHTYTTTGSNTISVDLVDEDGTHTNAGNLDVTVMSSGQPVNIIGTPGNDNLIGTNLDENLLGNGGAFDFFTGGGGADIFTFTTGSGNGREVGTITDYMPGEDMIDLDGSTILTSFGTGSTTYLFLDGGEFDTLIVNGVGTVADIDFL